jgi:hypothetical protein
MLPPAQQVHAMTSRTQSLDIPTPRASPKRGLTKDTAQACRDRASADLLKSVAMLTANQRLTLERSAASWTLRADMLAGLEASAQVRKSSLLSALGAEHVRL